MHSAFQQFECGFRAALWPRIRGLVHNGNIAEASSLLGSDVFLRGVVRSLAATGCGYDGQGAMVSLSPMAAMPPRGSYPCMIGGEAVSMTIAGPLSSLTSDIAGWVHGPVDIRRQSTMDISLRSGPAAVACPESLRALERVA